MRQSGWTPSIVPNGADQTVYLVVDDFGGDCRIFHEADVEETDLETVIRDLMSGQYNDPIRVIAYRRALVRGCVQEYCARESPPRRSSASRPIVID